MAQLYVQVGGHQYELACRDGEEEHLHALIRMVDRKVADASRSMGGLNEARQLLFAALLLADELADARNSPGGTPPQPSEPPLATAIERLADRMESLAERLESGAPSA
jgi:cell division protein ZapA